VNEEYPGPGQFPVIVVKSTGTATGFKNEVLTKEEFSKELKNHYYKASLALMRSGEPIMRFKPSGMVTQSYAQYIKDTHNFPIQDGQVAMPVNKVIYLAPESLERQFPEITGTAPKAPEVPKTPTPPPTAPKPVVAGVQNKIKNLSILSFDAALSAAEKSPGADLLVDLMKKVGKEFYNIALNTVLADPTKLTDIYYFKLVKDPEKQSVSLERRKYDPEDADAINASHFLGRVNVEGREKPVTVILVDPNVPFGKTYGTPRIMATIDLANPQEAVIQTYQQFTNPTPTPTPAPVTPTSPKRSMSALNAMRVGEVEKVEQASDSPFSDALLNEEELRAQAKESKEACKGDLDDLA
jgi:hypothetical protein